MAAAGGDSEPVQVPPPPSGLAAVFASPLRRGMVAIVVVGLLAVYWLSASDSVVEVAAGPVATVEEDGGRVVGLEAVDVEASAHKPTRMVKGPQLRGFKPVWVHVGTSDYRDTADEPEGTSYSQMGQDRIASVALGCKRNGFFVDLASNDAKKFSNSLALERSLGWKGVCGEANPRYMWGLAHRECMPVMMVAGRDTDEPAHFANNGLLGKVVTGSDIQKSDQAGLTVDKRVTLSLGDLLEAADAPPVIDFLSLDIEGAEGRVMSNFPWDKFTFLVLCVERPKDALHAALVEHGYLFLRRQDIYGDETWVHKTLPNVDEVIAKYGMPGKRSPEELKQYPSECLGGNPADNVMRLATKDTASSSRGSAGSSGSPKS